MMAMLAQGDWCSVVRVCFVRSAVSLEPWRRKKRNHLDLVMEADIIRWVEASEKTFLEALDNPRNTFEHNTAQQS